MRFRGDETDRGGGDGGGGVEDPVEADRVVGVDFRFDDAVLFRDEDGDADGDGVVEGLRDGGGGGWVGGEGGGGGGGGE